MKLCNVPQDLLAKQAIIDTIPNFAWLIVLSGIIAGTYYLFKFLKDELKGNELVGLGTIVIVTWMGCIAMISRLLTTIITAIANPEYAAMVKFAAECTK